MAFELEHLDLAAPRLRLADSTLEVADLEHNSEEALKDDLNTPILIAHLFDGAKSIQALADGRERLDQQDLNKLKSLYHTLVFEVLGMRLPASGTAGGESITSALVEFILKLRQEAKLNKDYASADRLRDELTGMGVQLKDHKDGTDWEIH